MVINGASYLSHKLRCEKLLRNKADELGVSISDLIYPLRVAITGSKVSLPLLESMQILGRDKCRQRIKRAIKLLEGT